MNFNQAAKNITIFPIAPNASTITILYLHQNQISNIPPQIKSYSGLRQLHMQMNVLEFVPKEIGELKFLTHLHLFNNRLSSIPEQVGDLKSLQVLRLENNQLKELPTSICKLDKLIMLRLTNNSIGQVPENIGNLELLSQLMLGTNKLKSIPESIGNLKRLKHLDLSNNDLSYFPESMRDLNLDTLNIQGNPKLPIPENMAGFNSKQLIEYVLSNQTIPVDELNTRRFYTFKNISSDEFRDPYIESFASYVKKNQLEEIEIKNSNEIDEKMTIVFFIVPFDVHENEELIFELIDICIKRKIKFYILLQNSRIDAEGLINLEKGKEITLLRNRIDDNYNNYTIKYTNIQDLFSKVMEGLKQHTPNVRIQNIVLKNIGHFVDINIDFDEAITCIIGENGTGKSTILRAIALAIIGQVPGVAKNKLEKLLRIQNIDSEAHTPILDEEGSVELVYNVDGVLRKNIINFRNNNGHIEITEAGDGEILSSRYNLKLLILGFPQVRNEKSNLNEGKNIRQANISDLIPLVNNQDDNRVEIFSKWILNIYAEATQKVSNSRSDKNLIEEFKLIDKIFSIVSNVMNQQIKFIGVDYSNNMSEIIVSTFDSKRGTPLSLLSEGFKIILGWVGYLLQRLSEAYPLSKDNFNDEFAIVIVDEVDTYIHPKWQMEFLLELKKIFPNIQFITSSHSPLVVSGLKGSQIVDLKISKEGVMVQKPFVDGTENLDVDTILLTYFGLNSVVSKELQNKIEEYYKLVIKENFINGEKERLEILKSELSKTIVGKNVHDTLFHEFLKFLNKKGMPLRANIKNIHFNEEEEIELVNMFKKYI